MPAFIFCSSNPRLMQTEAIAALLAPFLGGASVTEIQLEQLRQYLDLLLRWNARINLTAVRDPRQMVTRHFGESLFAARHLYPPAWKPETGNWELLDVGSGAGFPGLPIKIWTPGVRLTLLESNQRKTVFLREVVRALQLTAVDVVATRAEHYSREAANHGLQLADCTVTLRAVERFAAILPTAVRLLGSVPARERRLALLIGASQVGAARHLAPSIVFSDPLPVPQSSQRVLLAGYSRPPDNVS